MKILKNKIIIVIGANGLLGKEFVKSIKKQKGNVISADITNNNEYYVDITSKKSINKLISKVENKYGKIDAVVNTSYPRNKNYGKEFFDVKYKDFCENTNLHLGGYFLVAQSFASFFKKQGYGNIVNIASIYGVIAPKFNIYDGTNMTMPVEYAAIKSAIIHLTQYMTNYLKDLNIRVNCISPGGIFDNQDKKFVKEYAKLCTNKGILDKEDINGTLIFLLSDLSKSINGQNIIVDEGFTV